jgi:hypothetical protein
VKVEKLKYGKVSSKIIDELKKIVGEENVSSEKEDLICYSRDASLYQY